MSYSTFRFKGRRALRVTTISSALLLLPFGVMLAGCGGGGGGTVVAPSVYAAKTASATKMPLGALTGDLQVTTAAKGSTATATLTLVDPTRATVANTNSTASPGRLAAASMRSRLIIATPNLNGTYDPKTGAISLTGAYEYPAGTKHTVTATGNLPVAPAGKGTLTFTVDGTTYGPYTFGDNTPASTGTTGGTGTTGTTGGTGTTGPDSLTVSGAVGTTDLKNGPFSDTFLAVRVASSLTIFGASYDGEYVVATQSGYPDLRLSLYGLDVVVGKTFDIAKQTGSMLVTESSGALYLADTGSVTATAVSATSLTVNFTNVHFKPVPNGLTPAANQFTLNGSITAPITQ